jgi:hypothetical protein
MRPPPRGIVDVCRSGRQLAALWLGFLATLLAGSTVASAHQVRPTGQAVVEVAESPMVADETRPDRAHTIAAASPRRLPYGPLIIGLGLVLFGRRRRILALTVALVSLLFVYESGLHSVHHLDSLSEASVCAVAAAAAHVHGVVGPPIPSLARPALERIAPLAAEPADPASPASRVFDCRAPPVPSPA